jgi:hypothetical protein
MKTPSFPIERLHFVVAVVDFRWLIRRSAMLWWRSLKQVDFACVGMKKNKLKVGIHF